MRRPVAPVLLCALLAASTAGLCQPQARGIAVFPVQDRAGDVEVLGVVSRVLEEVLSRHGALVDGALVRDTARRLRLRRIDAADAEALRRLGGELGAEWIVSCTIHEALREEVPRLTVSIRILNAQTGDLEWASFEAASSLDERGVLERGVVDEPTELAEGLMRRMLDGLSGGASDDPGAASNAASAIEKLGNVALVPFGSLARWRATVSAELATECVRAEAHRLGVRLLPGNLVHRSIMRSQAVWGEVTEAAREELRRTLDADTILTGTVEVYEVGGGGEPEPRVTLSMRMIDVRTGRLLWVGGLERSGRHKQGLFRLGRVYSGGVLSKRLAVALLAQFLEQNPERKPV